VKGDAIAGLLITLLNIVVGLIVGTLVHGMPLGAAFETYAILTVGDGLVSQIPAVIISVAAGLLLARGGATGATDTAILTQLGRYPAAVVTVAVLMALFAFVPGLPFVPFILGALGLGWAGFVLARKAGRESSAAEAERIATAPVAAATLGDALDLDDIHVQFAPDLVAMVLDPATGLDARIANMRTHVASHYGLVLPEMRLTDDATLPPGTYVIRIQGVEQARDRLLPGRVLALVAEDALDAPEGEEVREPVYGAPARWLPPEAQEAAVLAGSTVVSPAEVLATHLLEVIRRNFARLLTLKGLRRLLDELCALSDPARAEANRRFFDELIPDKVPMDLLLAVLRLLLEERVSVRNMPLILEAISEARPGNGTPEAICEHVRQRLGFQLVAELKRADGTIPLIQLSPDWEQVFARHEIPGERGGADIALPPAEFNRLAAALADKLARASETGAQPAVVTSTRRRRFLRLVLAAKGLAAPVLSYEEIGMEARPALVGMVPA
jgi:flagellar biosynthesis protein FlhA